MRTETYFASAALVTQLERAGAIAHVHHDGGDIIHVELASGEQVLIHLIESSIPQSEIVATLEKNTQAGSYTLFLFWADRLLPPDAHLHTPEDWMRPLLALYHGRLYGYEVHGRALTIFPVHFEQLGLLWRVRYEQAVEVERLHTWMTRIHHDGLNGLVRAAGFGVHVSERKPPPHPLAREYTLLGLAASADVRAIKRAFRRLARLHHPDVNTDPAATIQMQKINEAYRKIMRALKAGTEFPPKVS